MTSTYIDSGIATADRFLPYLMIADEVRNATMSATSGSTTANAVKTLTTYSRWTPSAAATLTATFSGAKSVTYAAIYVTDAAGTYTLEWYNGSTWAAIGSALTRTGAGCVFWLFPAKSASALRIVCSSTPSIAVFKAGLATQVPVGMPVGYEPSLYNPTEKLTNTTSVTGQILGTQVEASRVEESMTFDLIEPTWISGTWMPLRALIRTVGVFLAWNLRDFSEQIVYGAMTGDPKTNYSQVNTMRLSLKLEGPKHVL